jgi:hypothetical protein
VSGTLQKPEDTTELNAWARHVAQTYIAWYTGFFALNVAGLGYVLSTTKPVKPLCYTFIFFNLLGVLSSTSVGWYGFDVHRRLRDSGSSRSPLPIALWVAILTICGFSLAAMALIWWKVTPA